MAVLKSNETTSMKLQYITDNTDGKETYSTVTVSGISKAVSDADFAELAEGMASLQKFTLRNMTRLDSAKIVEE
ncbi:hypothetical protein D081_2064 [Anaerovibrio sp. JC8]|uniref:DUF1659 domain-containing protein n=1 Tax=Anaerovibrio sp. JC8 TaxID=1240085 RepID=UPI000A0B5C1C|nr:hypothetical protein [Anaerovibrio sp. JC8]ORT99199.1 hypothetical protein D081_2064 [Anaerovibrio sp. JC8]